MAGKLYQRAEVSAQVRFTSHQQHLSVGAELLDLPLPLYRDSKKMTIKKKRMIKCTFGSALPDSTSHDYQYLHPKSSL